MKFHKALLLALVTFGLGFLLGWWWQVFSPGLGGDVAIVPPPPRPKPVFVTTEINKLRFSTVRIGLACMPDAKGNMNRFVSVDVAVENVVDPAVPVAALQIDNALLQQGAVGLPGRVHTKVLDKFSVPDGIYTRVHENAVILRFTSESPLEVTDAGKGSAPVTLKFTFGPAKSPVQLAPLHFPE